MKKTISYTLIFAFIFTALPCTLRADYSDDEARRWKRGGITALLGAGSLFASYLFKLRKEKLLNEIKRLSQQVDYGSRLSASKTVDRNDIEKKINALYKKIDTSKALSTTFKISSGGFFVGSVFLILGPRRCMELIAQIMIFIVIESLANPRT